MNNVFYSEVHNLRIASTNCLSLFIFCIHPSELVMGFPGDLLAEEDVLQWLILQKTEDTIETVNRNMLEVMLEDTQYLAVFFCKSCCS